MECQQGLKFCAIYLIFLTELVPGLLCRWDSFIHHLFLDIEGQPFLTISVFSVKPDHTEIHKPIVLCSPVKAHDWIVRIIVEYDGVVERIEVYLAIPRNVLRKRYHFFAAETQVNIANVLVVDVVHDSEHFNRAILLLHVQLVFAAALATDVSQSELLIPVQAFVHELHANELSGCIEEACDRGQVHVRVVVELEQGQIGLISAKSDSTHLIAVQEALLGQLCLGNSRYKSSSDADCLKITHICFFLCVIIKIINIFKPSNLLFQNSFI